MSLLTGLLKQMPPILTPEPPARPAPTLTPVRHIKRAPTTSPRMSAATATPEWRQARDQYLNHIMVCRACRAHLPKSPTHCPTGAELREQYDRQTTQHITSERAQEGQHA